MMMRFQLHAGLGFSFFCGAMVLSACSLTATARALQACSIVGRTEHTCSCVEVVPKAGLMGKQHGDTKYGPQTSSLSFYWKL